MGGWVQLLCCRCCRVSLREALQKHRHGDPARGFVLGPLGSLLVQRGETGAAGAGGGGRGGAEGNSAALWAQKTLLGGGRLLAGSDDNTRDSPARLLKLLTLRRLMLLLLLLQPGYTASNFGYSKSAVAQLAHLTPIAGLSGANDAKLP